MSLHLKLIIPLVLLAILIIFFILLCPVLKFLRCRSNSSSSSALSRFCASAWGSTSDANSHKSSATSRCARAAAADGENEVQLIPVSRPVHPRRSSFPESHLSSAEEGSQTVLIPLVCSPPPPLPPGDRLRTGGGQQPEQYRVCHLAIDGGTNGASVAPIILVGCNGGGAHAHDDDDDDSTERTQAARAAVERIYVALQRPPTYEEATSTRTLFLSTPETEARTSA